MRIGIYHPNAAVRHASGLSIFVQETARRLSERHEVFLYTEVNGDEVSAPVESSAVEVVDIGKGRLGWKDTLESITSPFRHLSYLVPRTAGFLNAVRHGLREHINENVDVLLTHVFIDDIFVSRLVEVPVVYRYSTFHRVDIEVRARERFSDSASVLASSDCVADAIAELLGYDVDGVVRAGVDTERFSPDTDPQFDSEVPTVLYVGRFVEPKGVFDLVDAFGEVDADCRLALVGGRGTYDDVVEYVAASDASDRITVHGTVPHDEIAHYYAACDVFCLPSYYESLGMVNLEAMATGTPVLTTDVAGITEYATDGENARLVTPGDTTELASALQELVRDPELRTRLGRNGRQRALQFSWPRQVEKLEAHCEDVVARHAPS